MSSAALKRNVFYISDGTAITCETVGRAVLGQFPFSIETWTYPYIETEDKLADLLKALEGSHARMGEKPLVFFSMVLPELRQKLLQAPGRFYDVLGTFVDALQADLGYQPKPKLQRSHSFENNAKSYFNRIGAIEYTLAHDDGVSLKHLEQADIILLGVSRSGKTPTSLYMALQFGLRVVNYPFISEDIDRLRLLPAFEAQRHKLFGLTIDPTRLTEIRNNRFSDSEYASSEQCEKEIAKVESLFRFEAIPYLNTSQLSVEEIATRIVEHAGLRRHLL